MNNKKDITYYLKDGAANAQTAIQLATLIGCNTRDITAAIQLARLQGAPICSNNSGSHKGYYLGNEAELYDCCYSLHHRICEQSKTLAALKSTYKNYRRRK